MWGYFLRGINGKKKKKKSLENMSNKTQILLKNLSRVDSVLLYNSPDQLLCNCNEFGFEQHHGVKCPECELQFPMPYATSRELVQKGK